MPVSELLDRMSSAEFTEWIAYLKIKNYEAEQARKKG